jgi:hypothetical protein
MFLFLISEIRSLTVSPTHSTHMLQSQLMCVHPHMHKPIPVYVCLCTLAQIDYTGCHFLDLHVFGLQKKAVGDLHMWLLLFSIATTCLSWTFVAEV